MKVNMERRNRRKTSMSEQREWSRCCHYQANLRIRKCVHVYGCAGEPMMQVKLHWCRSSKKRWAMSDWVETPPPPQFKKQPLIMKPWKNTNCLSNSLVHRHARTHTNTHKSSQPRANAARYFYVIRIITAIPSMVKWALAWNIVIFVRVLLCVISRN